MVEVDVFWAYGFGASLALGAGRQLVKRDKPFESKYFVWTVLFLALCWAPTGMLLLIRHPSWETMQAADSLASMNEFLILGFGLTNITQGILGFWVGVLLLRQNRIYLANLNWMLGYFGMFFILVYGWDGLGFDRFFYDRDMVAGSPAWTPGVSGATTLAGFLPAVLAFLTSGVAFTLYLDGVYLLPPFGLLMFLWYTEGLRAEGRHGGRPDLSVRSTGFGLRMLGRYLLAVFVIALGAAIFSAVVVNYVGAALGVGNHVARGLGHIPANTGMHVLSYVIGLPLALTLLWFTVLKPGGLVHRLLGVWVIGDEADTCQDGKQVASAISR
jgi:hypothetical protein